MKTLKEDISKLVMRIAKESDLSKVILDPLTPLLMDSNFLGTYQYV
jgi:hypothetical protein